MTQILYFEPAWERTMSEIDWEMIVKTFEDLEHESDATGLMSTYLRHAYNHRGRLLYTVLLHNYQEGVYVFKNKKVTLLDMDGHMTSEIFTLPVEIPPHSSMPWTFIFSASKIEAGSAALLL